MFTPAITKEMVRELHQRLRAGIEAAGNPTDYFAGPARSRLGHRLTTSGWQLVQGPSATENPLVAISDRDLYDRLKVASSPEECFAEIITKGMPYANDKTSGELSPLGLHGEQGDLGKVDLPRADQDPRVVTVDLDYMAPMNWADAHWFDLAAATPVARVRTDCEAESWPRKPHLNSEVMLWRTARGRWVAEIADPALVGEEFDTARPAWAEIAPEFAAHAIWCQNEAELTVQARTVPLAVAALAARGVTNPGALERWGDMQIRGDDLHWLAHHDHEEHVVALRIMLIAALGRKSDEVWREAGQVLADWTWIAHVPTVSHRFGAVWAGSDEGAADVD